MLRRLQLAVMAGSFIATSLYLNASAHAQAGAAAEIITASTDDSGHKVYVNDEVIPVGKQPRPAAARRSSLVYWSNTDRCWKAVPAASMRAAHSAVYEVNQILARSSQRSTTGYGLSRNGERAFTQQEIDLAIDRAAHQHNLDPSLVRAVIKVESNFNPNAVSPKGAMGLMQLMPQTARELSVTNPFDPQQNVDAGVRHLKRLMESYGGDVSLTLAAYNAGARAVARSAGIPNYRETKSYVSRISSLYYGTPGTVSQSLRSSSYSPLHVARDSRGVLSISNTD